MKALLVVSLLAGREGPRTSALIRLAGLYGPVGRLSHPIPFDFTDYYRPEMGGGLSRRLACFDRLVGPHDLADIKNACLALEDEFAENGQRRVNLDPGLLHEGGLILASTKWAPHRLPLAPGLFCELTLHYANSCYNALPWTYRDYAGDELSGLCKLMRQRFFWLKSREDGPCNQEEN